MDPFQEQQTKARRLTPSKITRDLFAFIRTIEGELAQLNRDALHERGEDVHGRIAGVYSRATELITTGQFFAGERDNIKKAGEPFDFKEENIFLPSIFAKVESDSIFFGASDPKLKDILQNTLTDEIFGLQDEDLNRAIERRLLPFFINYLVRRL